MVLLIHTRKEAHNVKRERAAQGNWGILPRFGRKNREIPEVFCSSGNSTSRTSEKKSFR